MMFGRRIVALDPCEDRMEIDVEEMEYTTISDYSLDCSSLPCNELESTTIAIQMLPSEIVLKVFSYIGDELAFVGRVCKIWNCLAFKELYDRGMYEMEVLQDNFLAIKQFTLAIRVNPFSPNPYFKRGVAYYKESDDQLAIRDISKGLSLSPTQVDCYLMRAMLFQIQLQFAAAVEEASKAIQLDPENGPAYYLRGYNRFDLQDYEGSIADLSKCLSLPYPYKSKVLNCRGWCFKIRGDMDRALQDFTHSGRLNIHYTKPFVNKAIVLCARKDRVALAEEEKFLTEQLHKATEKAHMGSIYYTRAAIRQQWENFNGAIEDYHNAIQSDYHSPHKAYVSIGWCFEKMQDFKKAIEFYNQAISLKPSYSIAIEHRAGAKCRIDSKAAEEDCKLAIRTNPKNLSFAFRYLAAVQADGSEYLNAIKLLSEGLKVNPLDNDMLLNRAGYFTCYGDLANAIRDYDQSIKHRPDTLDAWKYRANAKFAYGDLTGALYDYDNAMRMDTSDIALMNNCSMAFFGLGDFDRANEFLNKALGLPTAASFSSQIHQNIQLIRLVKEKGSIPKQFSPKFIVDIVFEKDLSKKMKDNVKAKLNCVLKGSEPMSLKQRVLGWRKRARVNA